MRKFFGIGTRQGQSTVEYAVLVVILIAALLTMQQYIKRGFQGRYKTSVDDMGDQYDPYLTNSIVNYTLVSNSDSSIEAVPGVDPVTGQAGFFTNRVDVTNSVETKNINSSMGN